MFLTGAFAFLQRSASAIRDPRMSALDGQLQVERGWGNPRRSRVLRPGTVGGDC